MANETRLAAHGPQAASPVPTVTQNGVFISPDGAMLILLHPIPRVICTDHPRASMRTASKINQHLERTSSHGCTQRHIINKCSICLQTIKLTESHFRINHRGVSPYLTSTLDLSEPLPVLPYQVLVQLVDTAQVVTDDGPRTADRQPQAADSPEAQAVPSPHTAPYCPSPTPADGEPSGTFVEQLLAILSQQSLESVEEVTSILTSTVRPLPERNGNRRRRPQHPQVLWLKGKKRRAMALIRERHPQDPTIPPLEECRELFPPRSDVGLDPRSTDRVPQADSSLDITTITPEEVQDRLNRSSHSAPGLDGLTYKALHQLDPSGEVLSTAYNICLAHGNVPKSWKTAKIILIPKTAHASSIKDFRPIALQACIYKTFSAIIAKRMLQWAEAHSLLSSGQRGFRHGEGCHTNNYVLKAAIRKAKRETTSLAIAWLDLRNCFGSIRHDLIVQTLQHCNAGSAAVTLIKNIYTDQEARLAVHEPTTAFAVECGVLQGDPMSPILALIVLETLLRSDSTQKLAYADDIAIICKDSIELQTALNNISSAATAIGLAFNPSKSSALVFTGGRRCDAFLKLQDQPLPQLEAHASYRYLGTNVSLDAPNDPDQLLDGILRDLRSVDRGPLLPAQRLDALRLFVMPKVNFMMREEWLPKATLDRLDATIREACRRWTGMKPNSLSDSLYLPTSLGGTGVSPLRETYTSQAVINALRMLNHPEEEVRTAARQEAGQSAEDVLTSLNVRNPETSPETPWAIAQKALSWLAIRQRVHVTWRFVDNEYRIAVRAPQTDDPPMESNGRDGYWVIRRLFTRTRMQAVASRNSTNGNLTSCWESRASNFFIRDGRLITVKGWMYAFCCRNSSTSVKNQVFRLSDKSCRRCHRQAESIAHVVGGCPFSQRAVNARHRSCLQRLARAIPRQDKELRIEQTVPGVASVAVRAPRAVDDSPPLTDRQKPDIVILDHSHKHAVIIDVEISFPHPTNTLQQNRLLKIEKYSALKKVMEEQGWSVVLDAFIVGSNGAWPKCNDEITRTLGISPKYASKMREFIIADVINSSAAIFNSHVKQQAVHGPRAATRSSTMDARASPSTSFSDPCSPSSHDARHLPAVQAAAQAPHQSVPDPPEDPALPSDPEQDRGSGTDGVGVRPAPGRVGAGSGPRRRPSSSRTSLDRRQFHDPGRRVREPVPRSPPERTEPRVGQGEGGGGRGLPADDGRRRRGPPGPLPLWPRRPSGRGGRSADRLPPPARGPTGDRPARQRHGATRDADAGHPPHQRPDGDSGLRADPRPHATIGLPSPPGPLPLPRPRSPARLSCRLQQPRSLSM